MKVRAFTPEDAGRLAQVFHNSVRVVGARDYLPAQLEAWSPAPVSAERFLARVSDGRSVFVAVTPDDLPVGFIELEVDGHIDCFYCDPDWAGAGVGAVLYAELEAAALSAGNPRLYVEASEAARRFFLRHGFVELTRQTVERNGIPLHNYRMEKAL